MGLPQIIYLMLVGLGLGIGLVQHGQPKEGNHNIVYDIIATAIVIGLLWWGHFFG